MDQVSFFQALRTNLWDAMSNLEWGIPAWVCIDLIVVSFFFFLAWTFLLSDYFSQRRLPRRLMSLGFRKASESLLGGYEKDGLKVGFIAMDDLGYTGWIHTMGLQADNPNRTALTQAQWSARLSDATLRRYKKLSKPWQDGGCDLQIAVTDQYVLAQWRIPFTLLDLLLSSDRSHLSQCIDIAAEVRRFLPRTAVVAPVPPPAAVSK